MLKKLCCNLFLFNCFLFLNALPRLLMKPLRPIRFEAQRIIPIVFTAFLFLLFLSLSSNIVVPFCSCLLYLGPLSVSKEANVLFFYALLLFLVFTFQFAQLFMFYAVPCFFCRRLVVLVCFISFVSFVLCCFLFIVTIFVLLFYSDFSCLISFLSCSCFLFLFQRVLVTSVSNRKPPRPIHFEAQRVMSMVCAGLKNPPLVDAVQSQNARKNIGSRAYRLEMKIRVIENRLHPGR